MSRRYRAQILIISSGLIPVDSIFFCLENMSVLELCFFFPGRPGGGGRRTLKRILIIYKLVHFIFLYLAPLHTWNSFFNFFYYL